jgi:hypothetical protein
MDPMTVALLLAAAGGLGTGAGEELWHGLTALMRRPFVHHGASGTTGAQPPGAGVAEVALLEQAPDSRRAAERLAEIIALRAEADGGFAAELRAWLQRAGRVYPAEQGGVHNSITGGTFQSTVFQIGSVGRMNVRNDGPTDPRGD